VSFRMSLSDLEWIIKHKASRGPFATAELLVEIWPRDGRRTDRCWRPTHIWPLRRASKKVGLTFNGPPCMTYTGWFCRIMLCKNVRWLTQIDKLFCVFNCSSIPPSQHEIQIQKNDHSSVICHVMDSLRHLLSPRCLAWLRTAVDT